MHFDSTLRRSRSPVVALLLCLLAATASIQALLIPPQPAQDDIDALQHYNDMIEALHDQSGGYHQRFKALAFQDASQQQQVLENDGDDNVPHDDGKKKNKGGKKHPKDGDGKDKVKLVPVVLGVMSKWVLLQYSELSSKLISLLLDVQTPKYASLSCRSLSDNIVQ